MLYFRIPRSGKPEVLTKRFIKSINQLPYEGDHLYELRSYKSFTRGEN